jgi:CD109 antigen
MNELYTISNSTSLNELEVYVEAQVEDPYFYDLVNGSFIATLYEPRIKLKLLGKQPRAFKPNSPYTTFVAVTRQDGTPLPPESTRNTFVRFRVETNGEHSSMHQGFIPVGPSSMVSYTFTPSPGVQFISVTAVFVQNDFEDADSLVTERAVRYKSPTNSFISISSTTWNPQVGDFMIFTVRVSQPIDLVYYHIVSSSRVILTDSLVMNSKQTTFDIGLTREMSPSAHIVAYYVRYDGEIVADSFNFHVNASSVQNKVNMTINRRKDFTGDTVEILAYASPQSYVAFAAIDDSILRLYNDLTSSIITELTLHDELYSFDKHANVSFSHTWMAEMGFAERRVFFPSNSYAYDALSTFRYTGLIVFTDLPLVDSLSETICNITE